MDDTIMVNAGDEGMADVVKGDQVDMTALVVGGKADAVLSRHAQLRRRRAPGRSPHPAAPGLQPTIPSATR